HATPLVSAAIALRKRVDPRLKSGTLAEYGMAYVGFGPFESGMAVIAPIAVVYGFTARLGWISVALAISIYLLAKFGGWMPPRGTIFAQGIGNVGEKVPKG